jgi:hypothetical protein
MGNTGSDGTVCSTALADTYRYWQWDATPNDLTWPVPPTSNHGYTKNQTVNAGNQLWWAIYGECLNGAVEEVNTSQFPAYAFAKYFVVPPSAGCTILDLCNRAAWQVLNCFAWGPDVYGSCGRTEGNSWNTYANDAFNQTGASSISPDYLLGRSGYPNNTSIWASYADAPLQWNGSGSTYGCWE